ncbi:MAG: S24 family peptidase [Saprospiraceae bacterium]|nr:S24 family peptidase [Saprospiraceae bacterium]
MSDLITLRKSTFINIPMFSQGEYAIQVSGHSMNGFINHGDWIVVKRITNRDAIIYGEPYLVVTKTDNLKTVKFVKPSQTDPESLTLIPYNTDQFEEQDMPKDEILELYRWSDCLE